MTTTSDVRAACQHLHETFCPATCLSAFPVIEVSEIGSDVALTARRWSESYPSPAAALAALPKWGTRFNRAEEEVRGALREAGYEV